MALQLYLLKQTRVTLLKHAIEGGYVNPYGHRVHGLSDFTNDLAQRSFHAQQQEPVTLQGFKMLKYTIVDLQDVIKSRPFTYTVRLDLVAVSTVRYVDLATQFGLEDRTIYFTISNFLNAVALDFIRPGAWPNKLQGFESFIPPLPIAHIDPENLAPVDLTDQMSYSISRIAHNNLVDMGIADGYIVRPDLRKKTAWRAYGLSSYLETLSFCTFVDTRPPIEPGTNMPLTKRWYTYEKKTTHPLHLSLETRARFMALANTFEIFPQMRYTETAIVSAVLDAIGSYYLTPTTRPTKTLQHGPTLSKEQQ